MQTTTNYGLPIPVISDPLDTIIDAIGEGNETIDSKLKELFDRPVDASTIGLWNATQNGVIAGDSDTYADINTTAIQNMLNNPSCPGIYFPPSTYRVNGIQLKNGKSLVGAGAWATNLKAKSTLQTAVITATNAYGSRIRDLYVDGNKFGGANCDGIVIQTSSPPPYYNFLFQLTHCAIYFCRRNGLYLKA